MDNSELKALQGGTVAEVTAALPGLDRDQLTELLALEADSNSPRETLTKAITARIEKIDADDEAVRKEQADPASKKEPPNEAAAKPAAKADAAKPAPHHHPDYAGPLTIDQAAWRHRNLKPAKVTAKK